MDFLEDLYKSIDDWNIEYNNLKAKLKVCQYITIRKILIFHQVI